MGANFFLMRRKQDARAYDLLTDKAESFTIKGLKGNNVTLHLYPLQLGRLMLISKRLLELDFAFSDDKENDVKRMWKLCAEQPKTIAEIIAIATLPTKKDIDEKFEERTNLILHSPTMTPTAIGNLFMTILFQSYYADFTNAIRSARMFQVMISPATETERIASTEEGLSGGK